MDPDSSNLTFAELGIRSPRNIESSIWGKRRTLESIKPFEWAFLVISLSSILSSLAFTLYRMSTLSPYIDDYVFAILMLINSLFCLLYVIDGVFREQSFEIIAFLLTTIIVLVYVAFNFISATAPDYITKLARLIVTASLAPPILVLGSKVAWNFFSRGALIFRTVGANTELQNACQWLYLAHTLLAFDAQAMASLLVLVLRDGILTLTPLELWTLVAGSLITGMWLLLGYLAMRFESKDATVAFLALSLTQPAYIIYKIVETPQDFNVESILYKSAFLASAHALFINVLLVATTIMVLRNYGKGLRQKVYEALPGSNIPSRSVD